MFPFLKTTILLFLILQLQLSFAKIPVDVIFDIDLTIAALVHEGPYGDFLADSSDPLKGTVEISFDEPGPNSTTASVKHRYRIYDHLTDLMIELKRRQDLGEVGVSFFSGGFESRNLALLDAIKLKDGSSLLNLATQVDLLQESLAETN